MALILIEGFDHVSSEAELLKKPYISYAYFNDVGSSYKRFDGQGVKFSGNYEGVIFTIPDTGTLWMGGAVKFASGSFGYSSIYELIDFKNSAGSQQCHLHAGPSGELIFVRHSSTQIATSATGVLTIGNWHYIELYLKVHDTAGEVIVKVNGSEVINATALDTQGQTAGNVNQITISICYDCVTYWDDVYFNDSEFMGDIKVVTKLPNANGTYSDFTPLSGSNYENVDEVTPDDDTTYNTANEVGQKESFTVPTTGIDGEIKGVQYGTYTRKSGTKTAKVKNLARVGGSDYLGDEETLGLDYAYQTTLLENNPDTTNPWTLGELGSSEFGVVVTSLSTTTTT